MPQLLNYFFTSQNIKNSIKYTSSTTIYPVFYFMNGLVSLIIIVQHRLIFHLALLQFSAETIDELPNDTNQILIGNILDISFMISGYLLYDKYMHKFTTASSVDVAIFLIFRWLRKISMPLILLPIMVSISVYMNDDPLYFHYISSHAEACKTKWWMILLAVNNFDTTDQMCLTHTWFTSAEIQLTMVGTILLFVMARNTKMGWLLVIFITLTGTITLYMYIYNNSLSAIFNIPVRQMNLYFNQPNNRLIYMRPYTRMGPYLLGMLTACITKKLNKKKYQFTMTSQILIMSATTLIAVETISYGSKLNESDFVLIALYGSTHRMLLMLPFSTFICIVLTSNLGVFKKIFENRLVILYGRLLNCVYQIGPPLQFFQILSQQNMFMTTSTMMLVWLIIGDFFFILLTSLLVHLALEAPTLNILKYVQKKVLKSI